MSQAGSVRTDLKETSRRRVLSVAYWRFFVNALLVFCDMLSFILAAVVVLMTQSEINLYSSRFHFHIQSVGVCGGVCAGVGLLPAQCGGVPPPCDGGWLPAECAPV